MKYRVSAIDANGFYRCGRRFTQEGVIVEQAEFEPAQWAAIKADPRLRVDEAPDAEGDTTASEDEVVAAITAVLGQLETDDFGADGKPKVPALRKLLPDMTIGASHRDAAWAQAQPPAPQQ